MLRCLVKGAGATETVGAAPSGALEVRGQHGDSTGAAKCPFQEIDSRVILIHINILSVN